jgi:hypothetical protein
VRSITGQDNAVLNARDGYSVWVRVYVHDGSGFVDVTTLEGRDWLVQVDWDESVNEPCAQATVQLRRQLEDYSLNPLVSNKLTGLLALGRAFYIETATVPLGDRATSEDWREVFRGEVEEISFDKDPITFVGRDMGGRLLRTYIETDPDTEYGSTGGTVVESVIQSILTDNSTGVTIRILNASGGSTTGAVFGPFPQKKAPVLAAVREAAIRIGWDLRYRWDDTSGTFRLTLIEPKRNDTTSVWTFQTYHVKAVTRLQQSVHDVRNAVRLYYYNRSAADASGVAPLAHVTSEDAASIATYGRLYMQLSEDEKSPIDSAVEAQRMADAARDDLKEPLLDFGVDVGFHYAVQLGDVVTFAADNIHFSSPQVLAVVSAAHSIGVRGHSTSLTLRGKPVGANASWLRRESRTKAVNQVPTALPYPVTGLAATSTAGGAVITFTAPTVPPLPVEYELHLSTSSGFTPSSVTFVERASTTSFTRNGLTPGTTYYAKVVSRDEVGNRTASGEVSVVPRHVAPVDLLPIAVFSSLNPNPSFEAWTQGTSFPPDTWSMDTGTWGVDVERTTTADSGGYALRFPVTTSGEKGIISQFIAVTPGLRYALDGRYYRPSGVPDDESGLHMEIRWYTSTFSEVDVGTRLITEGVLYGGWVSLTGAKDAPATARYARVVVGRTFGSVETYVDHVFFRQYTQQQETWKTIALLNSFTASGGGATSPGYYLSTDGRVYLRGRIARGAGVPAGGTAIGNLPTGYIPTALHTFGVRTDTGQGEVTVGTDGAIRYWAGGVGYLSLDEVGFRIT